MVNPARAGATMRVLFHTDWFSDAANMNWLRSTRWGHTVRRAGPSKLVVNPVSRAMTTMCHTWTEPMTMTVAMAAARSPVALWPTMIRCLGLTRSARAPAMRFRAKPGMAWTPPTRPRARGEPVRRNTSQARVAIII